MLHLSIVLPKANELDSNNSTTALLGAGASFTGIGTEVLKYQSITISIFADQDSAADGMQFQFSQDNVNWDDSNDFNIDISQSSSRRFQFPVVSRYFRVKYTNGTTPQGAFRVQTILHTNDTLTSIHRIDGGLNNDRSVTVVKSVISGQNSAGSPDFVNVKVNPSGTLEANVNQATHDDLNANANIQIGDADVDDDNSLPVMSYKERVQRGLVTGVEIFEAFGERDNVGTTATGEDFWRGNELTPSGGTSIPEIAPAGVLISWVSENDADNGATATGILTFKVYYLDINGDEQVWNGTSNGTTPVNSGILMRSIQSASAATVGSNGVAEGNCKIYKTGDTSTVYNMISAGGNQTLCARRMVPNGKTLYLQSWDLTEANSKKVATRIRLTDDKGVLNTGVFTFKDSARVKDSATGQLDLFTKVPAFSVIKISGWADTAGAEVSGGFWGYLVDNP